MEKFKVGDHVKLKKIPRSQQSRSKSPWKNRIGIITRVGLYNQSATIIWEGRRAPDEWPITALIRVQ